MKEQENQLIPLLRQAAQRWLVLGHQDIWDSEHYTDELGSFCNQVADKIETNAISDDEKKRLYFIFAPTCEWDDSVGDADLGNMYNFFSAHLSCREGRKGIVVASL